MSWNDLKNVILNSCDAIIPRFKVPSNPRPRWFNPAIRHQINCTRTLRRQARKHPSQTLMVKLKSAESLLQVEITKAKEDYLSNLADLFSSQPKKLYAYLSSLTQSKYQPKTILHNNQIVKDPGQKAKLFNEFFNSTFTNSNFRLPPVSSLRVPSTQLSNITITELEVYEALRKLDPSKAFGCDQISPLVLKFCADILAKPLHNLHAWTRE